MLILVTDCPMKLKHPVSPALVFFLQQSSSRSVQSKLNYKISANVLSGSKLERTSNSNFNDNCTVRKW